MVHELKTIMPFFGLVYCGTKNYELRKNDRDFKHGDTLILKDYNQQTLEYTGRECKRVVIHILKDAPEFGLMDGYVLMSLWPL